MVGGGESGKRKYRFKGSSVEHPVKPPPGALRKVRRTERHPGMPAEGRGFAQFIGTTLTERRYKRFIRGGCSGGQIPPP
jgi:hypothetical protein